MWRKRKEEAQQTTTSLAWTTIHRGGYANRGGCYCINCMKGGTMDWNRLLSISIQQIQINGGRHHTNNRCVHKITTD